MNDALQSGCPVPGGAPRAVAIVGRPNVGKSSLFNRLVRRRIAIVHREEGVTRDRLTGEGRWSGRAVEFMDTGGLGLPDGAAPGDSIGAAALRQTALAVEEAALILLVTDAVSGLTPLDEDIARRLRRSGRPVLLAANKADHPGLDDAAADFARLGFPAFSVSALHNRGIRELMDAAVARLPPPEELPAGPPLRVVVLGRPNAGKSSFINRLIGRERLIVSDRPGTTRDSVEIPFGLPGGAGVRRYLLIDTAGMTAPARSRDAVESFSWLRLRSATRRADVAVLILDAIEGPRRQDKRIAASIGEFHKGCVVLVNKWDLARNTRPAAYRRALYENMPNLKHVPVLFLSARTGNGVRDALQAVDRVAAAVATVFPTGMLNRVLRDAVETVPPPSLSGRRLKLFYAVQTGSRPPQVRIFINDPALVSPAYERYLVQTLRNAFDLVGTPVRIAWTPRGGYRGSPSRRKPRGG